MDFNLWRIHRFKSKKSPILFFPSQFPWSSFCARSNWCYYFIKRLSLFARPGPHLLLHTQTTAITTTLTANSSLLYILLFMRDAHRWQVSKKKMTDKYLPPVNSRTKQAQRRIHIPHSPKHTKCQKGSPLTLQLCEFSRSFNWRCTDSSSSVKISWTYCWPSLPHSVLLLLLQIHTVSLYTCTSAARK